MHHERAALARCVGDPDRFLAETWARRPRRHRADEGYDDLLSLDDVDHLMASTGLRTPAFRLVKDGTPLEPSRYTRTARIGSRPVRDLADVGRVFALFDEGATIVLQGLHRYWPPLTRFCGHLETVLTHPVQANAYITPPVASGLRVHADAHDVFALQTFGRKQWVTYRGEADEVDLDVCLQAGDCLYVPKGTRHAARTVQEASVHVTIGVRALSWKALLRRTVEMALEQLDDRALPPGYAHDPPTLDDGLGEQLSAFVKELQNVAPREVAEDAARRFWTGRTPVLAGQLRQLLEVDGVGDATRVRRRPGAVSELDTEGDRVALHLGDRRVLLPGRVEPAVRWIAERDRFVVGDLAHHLDRQGRAVLVSRLLREGLLMMEQ